MITGHAFTVGTLPFPTETREQAETWRFGMIETPWIEI
jgi:hypothetical protein